MRLARSTVAFLAALSLSSASALAQGGGADAGIRIVTPPGAAEPLIVDPPVVDPPIVDPSATPEPAAPSAPELPEAHRPSIEASLEPEGEIMTGDEVKLVIVATAPSGDDVSVPEHGFDSIDDLPLLDTDVRIEPSDEGTTRFVLTLRFVALAPGPMSIPAARLRVVTADGEIGYVATDAFDFEVGSVLGNEPNAEPRPATDPVEILEDDDTLWWILGVIGLLLVGALLALLFGRWWSRREVPEPPPPPPRPPWETALAKLDALHRERAKMFREGQGPDWVDGISDALREYLGGRYDFVGLESTTDEILHHLARTTLSAEGKQQVAAILRDCDLVKFAQATMSAEECDALIAGAVGMVRATMPAPLPNASASAPSTEASK